MIRRIVKALFVIIGTLIGAGFASGKEIYLFFYQYGVNGMIGIVISSILLGMVVYKVLDICNKNQIGNYKDFLSVFIKNERYLIWINGVINIFIVITFYIMIAGFGAYFDQQFGINNFVGSGLLAIICYFIFLKRVSGLVKVNKWIVPVLIGGILIVGMQVIEIKSIHHIKNYMLENSSKKWILDSILYGGYNTILFIPVLIALRKYINNRKEELILSIMTTLFVLGLAMIIFLMLTKIDVNMENLEMPIVYIASKVSQGVQYLYGIVILSSILTTSVSLGTSFLENIEVSTKNYSYIATFLCISSVIVSKVGFSNLVMLLYPIFGYIGIIQIIMLYRYYQRPLPKNTET